MKPITFCIPTAKNELEYVLLLLTSLVDNTQYNTHEFLVFVDSDNQNTFDSLQQFKTKLPNLRVCKNVGEFPVGGQRNISIMFNEAKNDIVCYLQSDMVVSKDFDRYLLESLVDENQILCFTRVEPPLHPASPEKFVENFGLHPQEFKYDEFLKFAENVTQENRPNSNGHFAPFATFKSMWVNVLGGFDTQFRCSREDSDMILRLHMNNIQAIQTWNAMVYHFTCVSSRGHEWYAQNKSKESEVTLHMQQYADREELKRYIRKWGYFSHDPHPVYDITFFVKIDGVVNFEVLKAIEPYCSRMILTDESIAGHLKQLVEFDSYYYSNYRWKYTEKHWNTVKHLFNPTDWDARIQYGTSVDVHAGVLVEFEYLELDLKNTDVKQLFENIQMIVATNEIGRYDLHGITINILDKVDMSDKYKKNNNLHVILNHNKFTFI
jgi:GT2 family glycosyltransferase